VSNDTGENGGNNGGVWTRTAALVLSLVVTVARIVRTTVRDIGLATSSIYYALPWTIIAALALVAAALWALGRRRRAAAAMLFVSMLSIAGAWGTSFFINPCVNSEDSTRLLFWNISRGRATWERIADEIVVHDADIIALTEAGKPDAELRQFWTDRFADYQVTFAGGGIVLISRLPVAAGNLETLDGISSLYQTTLEGQQLSLFLVDLDASPRFNKLQMIRAIFARVDRIGGPAITMGDFNAPLDARGFSEIRDRYHHAFESAGRGLNNTWPTRTPLVAIDHIWLSRDITAQCTRLIKSSASDHRAIVADVRLPR
jgi:endonuclease/exonuclease/phosphatase (EEP) superfamily protein YafD